jgi:hypothetical protein
VEVGVVMEYNVDICIFEILDFGLHCRTFCYFVFLHGWNMYSLGREVSKLIGITNLEI